MKKLFVLFVASAMIMSCEQSSKTETTTDSTTVCCKDSLTNCEDSTKVCCKDSSISTVKDSVK